LNTEVVRDEKFSFGVEVGRSLKKKATTCWM